MRDSARWRILETATPADREEYEKHVRAFVETFVNKERRERWLELLVNRPKRIFKHSSKLEEHLDENKCARADASLSALAKERGIFYDFSDAPVLLSVEEAVTAVAYGDGLFFITPGKLALCFSHEGYVLVCRS